MTTTVPFGLAEQTEIAAYTDFVTGAAAPLREALGIGSLHVGSALALAIREDPSRFFSRAGGFGAGEPITVDLVAQVCDFYRRQGVSQGAFMVAPPLQPPHWAATADELNLTPGNRLVKPGGTSRAHSPQRTASRRSTPDCVWARSSPTTRRNGPPS